MAEYRFVIEKIFKNGKKTTTKLVVESNSIEDALKKVSEIAGNSTRKKKIIVNRD
jgi:hypothetical protein